MLSSFEQKTDRIHILGTSLCAGAFPGVSVLLVLQSKVLWCPFGPCFSERGSGCASSLAAACKPAQNPIDYLSAPGVSPDCLLPHQHHTQNRKRLWVFFARTVFLFAVFISANYCWQEIGFLCPDSTGGKCRDNYPGLSSFFNG